MLSAKQVLLSPTIKIAFLHLPQNSLQKEKMATIPSLLWILISLICSCSSQTNRITIKMISNSIQIHQKVELECETNNPDNGMYWIFKNTDPKPHFILQVSARSKMIPEGIKDFEAVKSGNSYKLIVKNFTERNQGIYYCVVLGNQLLYFSPGLNVYLPVSTTQTPTTKAVPAQEPNISKEPMKCPDTSVLEQDQSDKGQKIACDLYIWAPLAGGCFLLLIILVFTFAVCCDSSRRRRKCRCKRPTNETNGKLSPRY